MRQNKIFHFNYEDFESNKNWIKSNDLIWESASFVGFRAIYEYKD